MKKEEDWQKDCLLDHVALAVENLEEGVKFYECLGLKFEEEREIVESQGVQTAFAPIDQHAHLELLAPLTEDGAIAKFLASKGPGIHHLCFRVADVRAKCEELKKQGIRFIYEEPQPGAKNTLVNFIHPKSAKGVLIELAQGLEQ